MQKIALISEKNLKEQSLIELNADNKVISSVILDVQELNLRPILGNTLYEKVLDEVYKTVTLTGYSMDAEIKKLLEQYIIPYLIYAVLVDWIVSNNYKLTNKGILKMNDVSAQNIQPAELEYAKDYFDNKMNAYKLRLVQYLKEKKFVDCHTDIDVTSASIGWYINPN